MKTTVFLVAAWLLAGSLCAQEKIHLAAEDNWYPYSAKRGNLAEGRSVDIVTAAYKAVEASLTLDVVPFNRGMVMTKTGIYDGVFNAGLNESVRRDYLIPRNYVAFSEQVVIARIDEKFVDRRSFNGKRLALTLGYTYPTDITGDGSNSIELAPADLNNLRKIAAGRADFTIIDRLVALSIFATEPALKQKLAFVGALSSENIYVLFSKSEKGQRARDLFDQGMDKIRGNGVLQGITSRWEDKLR